MLCGYVASGNGGKDDLHHPGKFLNGNLNRRFVIVVSFSHAAYHAAVFSMLENTIDCQGCSTGGGEGRDPAGDESTKNFLVWWNIKKKKTNQSSFTAP